MFINGKPVGSQLASHHHKAVVPCKAGRSYEVTLVAVSSDWGNSSPSNMLYIETQDGATSTTEDGSSHTDDGEEQDEPLGDVSILLKTTKVTDTSIYLDWSTYRPPNSVLYYRVIWSSAAQPMVSCLL